METYDAPICLLQLRRSIKSPAKIPLRLIFDLFASATLQGCLVEVYGVSVFSFGFVLVMFLLNCLVDCCNINLFIEISQHGLKVIGLCNSTGLVAILIFDLQNSFDYIHRFHIDAVARIVHTLEAFGL
jgi:hypothetical protein